MIIFSSINQKIIGLLLCSASLLIAVLYFEYVLDLIPCKLCYWQRVPHAAIVLLGFLALIKKTYRSFLCLGCLLAICSGLLISGFHVGIEYKIWQGPINCSANNLSNTLSPDIFLESLLKLPIIRCDEVQWSFLNLSMAGWNFFISIALTVFWSHIVLNVFRTRGI